MDQSAHPTNDTGKHAKRDAATFAHALASGDLPNDGDGLYRLLVESVADYAIFALDQTGHVLSWNPGAQRFKGYLAHEILGKSFTTFYPPEDVAAGTPQWELGVATREGRVEDEGWRVRKDGSRFWANVVITALRDENGALRGFAKVTRDLTERKAAEERAVEDARRMTALEQANEAKRGFLAAMSHELRTPLNAIAGYADLLLAGIGGTISPQQRQYVERIRNSQAHLLAIINDILNLTRIEAGRLDYDIAPVRLDAVIGAVVPMVDPQASAKKLRIAVERCRDDEVLADRARVEQILLNLLSNAVKFTSSGGRITIGITPRTRTVMLWVRDTGTGIPAQDLEAIFHPFVQVGRSFSSTQEGTGLGLAISSDLARGMEGRLTVTSEVGAGSTFSLELPRANAVES